MMYLAAPMPSKCSELRTVISTRIHRAIHLSHLIALRCTKRNYDRKQSMAEVQLRQLLGSLDLLMQELDGTKAGKKTKTN